MTALLGLDCGTTNIKAAIYSPDGIVLGRASRATPVGRESPYRALILPEELMGVTTDMIHCLLEETESAGKITAVGISSIGESVVPIDIEGKACFPALMWYDERTTPLSTPWTKADMARKVFSVTGLQVDHTLSAFKASWLKSEHPEAYSRVRYWLPIADYIVYMLTGSSSMSASLACRTMLFDLQANQWSESLVGELGLDIHQWPKTVQEGQIIGRVTSSAAKRTNLPEGTPVVSGGHDHVCAALAAGAIQPGIVLDSMGTTEAVFTTLERLSLSEQLRNKGYNIGRHVVPSRYYALAGILGAGGLLSWLRTIFWSDIAEEKQAYECLEDSANNSEPGAKGITILPYFAGSSSRHPNPRLRGGILGLTLRHCPGDVARAAIEALCFELKLMLADLEQVVPASPTEICVAGNAASNKLWRQIKADVLDRTIRYPSIVEAGCLGAAMVAGMASGVYKDCKEAVKKVCHCETSSRPNQDNHIIYDRIYRERFIKLSSMSGDLSGVLE